VGKQDKETLMNPINPEKLKEEAPESDDTLVALELSFLTSRGRLRTIIKHIPRNSTFDEFDTTVRFYFPRSKKRYSFEDIATSNRNRFVIESQSDWEAFLAGPCRLLKASRVKLRVLRRKRMLDFGDANGRHRTEKKLKIMQRREQIRVKKQQKRLQTEYTKLENKRSMLAEEQSRLDKEQEKLEIEQKKLKKKWQYKKERLAKNVLEMIDFKRGNFVLALENYFGSCQGDFEVVFQTGRLGKSDVRKIIWCTTVRILCDNDSDHPGVGKVAAGQATSKKLSKKRAALAMIVELGLVNVEDVKRLKLEP